jgi:hypothetical protein
MVKSTPISQLQQKKLESIDEDIDNDNIDGLDDEDVSQMESFNQQLREDIQNKSTMNIPSPKNMDIVQSWILQNNNLKYSLYVVGIFILVSNIPIEKVIYRYVSLNKIPLSDTIFKGLIAGIVFFILSKMLP